MSLDSKNSIVQISRPLSELQALYLYELQDQSGQGLVPKDIASYLSMREFLLSRIETAKTRGETDNQAEQILASMDNQYASSFVVEAQKTRATTLADVAYGKYGKNPEDFVKSENGLDRDTVTTIGTIMTERALSGRR